MIGAKLFLCCCSLFSVLCPLSPASLQKVSHGRAGLLQRPCQPMHTTCNLLVISQLEPSLILDLIGKTSACGTVMSRSWDSSGERARVGRGRTCVAFANCSSSPTAP